MEFLDRDLEFLAGTGAGEGLDFYDVKDITVNYKCAGEESSNHLLKWNVLFHDTFKVHVIRILGIVNFSQLHMEVK